MICIDASIAAKWVLAEDDSAAALDFYYVHLLDGLIAPALLPFEVTNAIWRHVPRGTLTLASAQEALDNFLSFEVSINTPLGLHDRALVLAGEFSQPAAYDMHYVALAEFLGCDLWTADQRLLNTLAGRLPFVKPLSAFQP